MGTALVMEHANALEQMIVSEPEHENLSFYLYHRTDGTG